MNSREWTDWKTKSLMEGIKQISDKPSVFVKLSIGAGGGLKTVTRPRVSAFSFFVNVIFICYCGYHISELGKLCGAQHTPWNMSRLEALHARSQPLPLRIGTQFKNRDTFFP
jgi:hypothetical protein